MTRAVRRFAAVTLLLTVAGFGGAEGAAVYQPRLAFRVLVTPHFRIYYHQGGEAQARRLARLAESVREELEQRTRLPAPATTHIVLANQDDDPNGLATPVPYPTIRLAAAWPATSDLIGNTDDWLRSVLIHEYAHLVQLERTRGWATVARTILGRHPVSFPNIFLPLWQIEGYATLWESRLTGAGRLEGGDAASIVRARARAGALPLDQANGGLVQWPGGNTTYLEGAWFHDYLTTRFGEEALGPLNDVTAGRFPYFSAPAFKRVFNQSLGDLWRDFQQGLVAGQARTPGDANVQARRLTDRGYWVTSPRFDASAARVVYSLRDPHGFPSLRITDADVPAASPGGVPASRVVADRFGSRFLSVRGGLVFFDELELRDNVAWRSDLRVLELASGRVERLTNDARLLEPDVSPDGRRLACVRVTSEGTRALAFFTVERTSGGRISLVPAPTPVAQEPGVTFGAPRWAPDGRRVAVERRRVNGPSEIAVIDAADGTSKVLASAARGRVMTPAWMPEGGTLLFAKDRAGEFQVYAVGLNGGGVRQVTTVTGGATFPDVSPDGRTLLFVGVGPSGYDVFALPIERSRWTAVPEADETHAGAQAAHDEDRSVSGPVAERSYSPVPTLLPRFWTPLADTADGGLRLGLGVGGADVLLRHTYTFSALWRLAGDNGSGAPAGRPDWAASYVYERWRPTFVLSASDRTSLPVLARPGGQAPIPAALREQEVTAGVAVPIRTVRRTQVLQTAFNAGSDTMSSDAGRATFGDGATRRSRPALRSAWAINTGKSYGWSISAEDGIAASITSEQVREGFGADGNADAFTGELRAYWRPGDGHAVLAGRAGYGVSSGDASVRRRFYLGGSMPAGPLVDFGSDAFRMLRGFDDNVTAGDRIAVATLEWRQPLLGVERGWGTVPILLRTLHGAVFVDAGQAWNDDFRLANVKTSVGAEAALDIVAGFAIRLTLTAGAAWTHDPTASRSAGAVYFRIGPSF
jgi:hypothetical protein